MTIIEMDAVFAEVDAPVAVPYGFGLLSSVTPVPDAGPWEGFGIQWVSAGCATPRVTYDSCIVDVVDPLTGDARCSIPQFQPFTVYQLVEGTLRNADRDARLAVAGLSLVEQFAVESELWGLMAAAVTEVAQTDLVAGLALTEQMLVEAYPATGVIHMSRYTATLLSDRLVRNGARLTTALGTPVVAGGGYDPVAGAAPTDAAIYGTGPLVLRRGVIPDPIRVTDPHTNAQAALAQRSFAVGWDCTAVGVTVTL